MYICIHVHIQGEKERYTHAHAHLNVTLWELFMAFLTIAIQYRTCAFTDTHLLSEQHSNYRYFAKPLQTKQHTISQIFCNLKIQVNFFSKKIGTSCLTHPGFAICSIEVIVFIEYQFNTILCHMLFSALQILFYLTLQLSDLGTIISFLQSLQR